MMNESAESLHVRRNPPICATSARFQAVDKNRGESARAIFLGEFGFKGRDAARGGRPQNMNRALALTLKGFLKRGDARE